MDRTCPKNGLDVPLFPTQVRALQAEGEWVRALDEMRLQVSCLSTRK
jgi:hypothetical protein